MNKITLSAASAIGIALTSQATAAEFTGARLEAHAGWERLQTRNAGAMSGHHKDGIMVGIGIGYDVAWGKRGIVGVEGDFDVSNAISKVSGTSRVKSDCKRDMALGARVGVKLFDNVLLYTSAAFTRARIKEGRIGSLVTTTSNRNGIRVGAGVEYAAGKGLYLKTEYRYSNYEKGATKHQLIAGVGIRF